MGNKRHTDVAAERATSPIYFVRYNTVQEQSTTSWESAGWNGCLQVGLQASPLTATFNFTDWSVLNSDQLMGSGTGGTPGAVTLQNCQLYSGIINLNGQTLVSTNCLYQRVATTLFEVPGVSVANTCGNSLFWNGSLTVKRFGAAGTGRSGKICLISVQYHEQEVGRKLESLF